MRRIQVFVETHVDMREEGEIKEFYKEYQNEVLINGICDKLKEEELVTKKVVSEIKLNDNVLRSTATMTLNVLTDEEIEEARQYIIERGESLVAMNPALKILEILGIEFKLPLRYYEASIEEK